MNYKYNKNRVGDHQWYITDYTKFKDFPNWRQNIVKRYY